MTTQRLYSTNYDYIKYENIIKNQIYNKIHLKVRSFNPTFGVYIIHHILGCFNKLNIVNANQVLFK